jgi:MoxR-like ATPase
VGRYIVNVGRRTRELPGVDLGVSSRAMIHLVMATKANARLHGRETVTIEDVREMAPYVLRHRISVQPGTTVDNVLLDAMATTPTAVPPPVSPVS